MPRFLTARGTPSPVASLAEQTRAGSSPVPPAWRAPVEARLGSSLASARLHRGPAVTAGLGALGTPAAALGRHVFLASTAPSALVPQMVRHELAHTAQARLAEPDASRPLRLGARGSALERQASRAAAGGPIGAQIGADANTLQRYDGPGQGPDKPFSSAAEATLDTRLFLLEELILDVEEDDPQEAARLERELLLVQFTHQEGFYSVEGAEEFIRACELDAEKENDTLRQLGADRDWILRQYPQAFPDWWADQVKRKLGIDVDPDKLKATVDAAWSALESLAGALPPYIAKFGLPVGFQQAQTLTRFQLSFDHAKLSEPHMVKVFAQAALRYRATAFGSRAIDWWSMFVNNLVADIRSGEVVVDPDEVDRLTRSSAKLGGFVRSSRTPAEDEFRALDSELVNLHQAAFAVALVAFGSSIHTGAVLWRQAATLFQAKLVEADAIIEDASFFDNIGRGFLWATELGYFGDSAALIAAAISDNLWEIVQTVLLYAGAQAVPVVNVLVDLYLLFTVGTDLVSAIIDLARAFKQAGESDTVVEMQRASARLAVALLQDTMRVVLDFLGIKGTVSMLERKVARIRLANPTISQKDAIRQAVREKQMDTATSPAPAPAPLAGGTPAGGTPAKIPQVPEPPAKPPAKTAVAPAEEAVSAAPRRVGGATTSTFVTYSHREMLELFIKMFKKPGPPQDAYHVYATVEAYEQAWLRLPRTNPAEPIPPGFFLPNSRMIHLPPNAGTLTVFHEALHWASNNAGFGTRMGQFVNEGMTEWLTQRAFGSQAYRINYGQNVAFVKLMAGYVEETALTRAFLDSDWQPLYSALERRLGSSDAAERFVDLLRRTPVEGGERVGQAMDMLMR